TPGFWPSAAAHSSVSVPCVLPSQLLPAFIGTGFITTTGSSDAHPALVGLASTLVPALPAPSRRTVMGLPGYVCLPEHERFRPNPPGYPAIGLSHFPQGYPPDGPTSVRFR